jgi:hypothetical protein
VGDIKQDAGLELVVGTLGYDMLAVLQFNRIVHLDLQVDMVAFWMSGKDGLEAVVASGLSALGAALENRESIVKAIYGNGILLLSFATAHELHHSSPQWQLFMMTLVIVDVMKHAITNRRGMILCLHVPFTSLISSRVTCSKWCERWDCLQYGIRGSMSVYMVTRSLPSAVLLSAATPTVHRREVSPNTDTADLRLS